MRRAAGDAEVVHGGPEPRITRSGTAKLGNALVDVDHLVCGCRFGFVCHNEAV